MSSSCEGIILHFHFIILLSLNNKLPFVNIIVNSISKHELTLQIFHINLNIYEYIIKMQS